MEAAVTIVIPVYKRTTYFRQALDSALAQTVPVKIIVHDASPNDAGFQKLIGKDADRVEYRHFENDLGIAGNWNRCLSLPQTKWVSMLHDDDLLTPQAIELLLQATDRLPGRTLYFGLDDCIDETGAVRVSKASLVDHQLNEISPETYAMENQFCAAGALVNHAVALSLGGFNTRLKMTPDWDLWMRLCLHSGAVRINEITAQYRNYFDLKRLTSQQELDGTKLLRINVQLRRNVARIKKQQPEFQPTAQAIEAVPLMAKGLLCVIGSKLKPKGRSIYFAYVRRLLKNKKGFAGKAAVLHSDLLCWLRVAYSCVRATWICWRDRLSGRYSK